MLDPNMAWYNTVISENPRDYNVTEIRSALASHRRWFHKQNFRIIMGKYIIDRRSKVLGFLLQKLADLKHRQVEMKLPSNLCTCSSSDL